MTTEVIVVTVGVTALTALVALVIIFLNLRSDRTVRTSSTMGRKKKPQQSKQTEADVGETSKQSVTVAAEPVPTASEAEKPVESIVRERCIPQHENETQKETVSPKEVVVTCENSPLPTTSSSPPTGKKNKKKSKKGGGHHVDESASVDKEDSPAKDLTSKPASTSILVMPNETLRLAENCVSELTDRVTQLTNQLAQEQESKTTEFEKYRNAISDLKIKLAESEKSQQKTQQDTLKSSSAERESNQRCSQLETELSFLQKRFDTSVKETANYKKIAEETQSKLANLEKKANDSAPNKVSNKDLEKQLKEKNSAISSLESDLKKQTEEIESQRQKNNTLRERNWLLVEQLSPQTDAGLNSAVPPVANSNKKGGAGGKGAARDLEKSLATANREVEALKSAKMDLEERLKRSSKESSVSSSAGETTADESVNHLKGQIHALRREKDNLTRQLKEVTNPKKSGNKKSSAIVNGGDDIQLELAALKTKISEVEQTNDQLKQALEFSAAESTTSATNEPPAERRLDRRQQHELQEELGNATARLWAAESERARLERVLRDTEGMLSRLQSAVDEEEGQWREALAGAEREADLARLELQRVAQQADKPANSEMQIKIQALETAVLELTKERDSLQKDLASSNQPKHSRNSKKGKTSS